MEERSKSNVEMNHVGGRERAGKGSKLLLCLDIIREPNVSGGQGWVTIALSDASKS